MAGLSDAALPLLNLPIEELQKINTTQERNFGFRRNYMSIEDYYNIINLRKQDFIRDWEARTWKEWNYGDWRAYRTIIESGSGATNISQGR